MGGEKSEDKSHPDHSRAEATGPWLMFFTVFFLVEQMMCGFRLRLSQLTDRKSSSVTV